MNHIIQKSISSDKYRKKQGTTFHSVGQFHLQSKLEAFWGSSLVEYSFVLIKSKQSPLA